MIRDLTELSHLSRCCLSLVKWDLRAHVMWIVKLVHLWMELLKVWPCCHWVAVAFPVLSKTKVTGWGLYWVNTLRPRQNGRRFADDTFKRIYLNETYRISIKISLKFVPKGPINNIQALVQIMAWRRPGNKPLSEPMMVMSTHAYMSHTASMS